jgi:hypothetical protein
MSRGSSGFAVLALKSDGTVMATYAGSTYVAGNLSYGKIALDSQYLYVCGQSSLIRFVLGDPSSGTTVYSNNQVFDVKPLPNGHLFVASAYNVDEITTSGTLVRHVQLTGGQSFTDIRGIEYNPQTNILFVTHLGYTGFSFKIMRIDATTGALLNSTTFNYADDLYLDLSGNLLVGSGTQNPTLFSQDLVQGNSLNGGQQMFITQYPPAVPAPGAVGNVSTRLPVGTGDNALIEGFIVQGPAGSTKKILVRAIGPSLIPFGITDALANPTLEIHDGSGATVATNNDWKITQTGGLITGDQSADISASGLAPGNDLESAIIANLAPGSYTAVVSGFGNTTGTGVVDAYDISGASPAKLANIATRGFIQAGDKLMIAGFIVQNAPVRAVVRAIGPSLLAFGISNALADTTLQLRDQNGAIVLENDDWKTSQQQELEGTGLQPSNDLEAALVTTIQPGQYTAQVRGKNDSSGIGVVQVYFLQ